MNLKPKKTTITKDKISKSNIRITDDYNFDGINDILIYDPEIIDEGCYNPQQNTNIFLSNTDGTFVKNESISRLINETNCLRGGTLYINMNKQICSQQTGGANSHYEYCYKLENNTLKLIKEISEDGNFNALYGKKEIKELVKGKWKTSSTYYFSRDNPKPIFEFETLNKKGKVLLFQESFYSEGTDSNNLYYAFMIDNETITFAHPNSPEKTKKMLSLLTTIIQNLLLIVVK